MRRNLRVLTKQWPAATAFKVCLKSAALLLHVLDEGSTMSGADEQRFLTEASQGRCPSGREIRRDRPRHEPELICDDCQRVSAKQGPGRLVNVSDVAGGMAGGRDCAELVLDDFAVSCQMIGFYCIRRSFLQQSAKQYKDALFRDVPAEPSTNATRSGLPGERKLVAWMVVDAHAKFAFEKGCPSGMIVVPVREKNCFQSILRDTYFLKAMEEIRCFGVHADVNREESACAVDNIRTSEIRGPAKAPYALGNRDDFELNVRLALG